MFLLRITIGLVLSVAVLAPDNCSGEPSKALADSLHTVTIQEKDLLPQPSINPIYAGWADYARTPSVCIGDDQLHNYFAGRWPQKDKLPLEFRDRDFISADINSNSIREIALSDEEITFVRNFHLARLRAIEDQQGAQPYIWGFLTVLTAPVAALEAAAGAVVSSVVTLVSFANGTWPDARPYKEGVLDIIQHVGQGSKLYRVSTLLSNQNRKYARVTYALYTQDHHAFVLSTCYYARHVH